MLFADGDTKPALAPADLDTLVAMARRVDENGVEPGDATNWTQSYDLNYAISQAWLVKAGRLAGHYNFMVQGKMFSRQQFYDHCIKQHKVFLNKSGIKAIRLSGDSGQTYIDQSAGLSLSTVPLV